MKTTIDIAGSLLNRSRKIARQEHVTLRELVEEGLNLVVTRHAQPHSIRIEPVTFKGEGLAPEFQDAGWTTIRDAIYKGHGA